MLSDPRLFNFVLIALNLCAALRWAWHGDWWQSAYWCFAAGLSICVVFGR